MEIIESIKLTKEEIHTLREAMVVLDDLNMAVDYGQQLVLSNKSTIDAKYLDNCYDLIIMLTEQETEPMLITQVSESNEGEK